MVGHSPKGQIPLLRRPDLGSNGIVARDPVAILNKCTAGSHSSSVVYREIQPNDDQQQKGDVSVHSRRRGNEEYLRLHSGGLMSALLSWRHILSTRASKVSGSSSECSTLKTVRCAWISAAINAWTGPPVASWRNLRFRCSLS